MLYAAGREFFISLMVFRVSKPRNFEQTRAHVLSRRGSMDSDHGHSHGGGVGVGGGAHGDEDATAGGQGRKTRLSSDVRDTPADRQTDRQTNTLTHMRVNARAAGGRDGNAGSTAARRAFGAVGA